MAGFNDFVQTELPKRPFTSEDGNPGDIPVRSSNALAARELVWVSPSSLVGGRVSLRSYGPVSAHRAMAVLDSGELQYAQLSAPEKYVGLSLNAVAGAGELVVVQFRDVVEELSWNWMVGPVFLGVNGILTQTPPTSGCVMEIGSAISATKILLERESPIFL